MRVHVLDYGAGNVRSLTNALERLGHEFVMISDDPSLFEEAKILIFPGVGAFGQAIRALDSKGFIEPLRKYLLSGKPFLGICIGLQILFESSEESPGLKGLGILPGVVSRFRPEQCKGSIPHMGWNRVICPTTGRVGDSMYFVHSFCAKLEGGSVPEWLLTRTSYGHDFISSIRRGALVATQFHPEKSGESGLRFISNFLLGRPLFEFTEDSTEVGLAKRIIACLDVRSNDAGDLVVTKGDQYDVREKAGAVRNMGKPVALARKYFEAGADELVFLNITSFRENPLQDMPMIQLLQAVSKTVFVPLTIGGGIRNYVDSEGFAWSALEVASAYFRAGADKVSLGSDAVYAAEKYWKLGALGDSAIEQISAGYGRQAVVISIDPKRIYVESPECMKDSQHTVVKTRFLGPKGEEYCWYQCTVKGGRESRDIDVVAVVRACEALGAGEILLNSIDMDGQCNGFDFDLINCVKNAVSIPVIASSGAGKPEHFSSLFTNTSCDAGLAAGMFHRDEYSVDDVKNHIRRTQAALVRVD